MIAAIASGGLVSPEGTHERNNMSHLAAMGLQLLLMVSPKGIQDMKTQDTGPRKLSKWVSEVAQSRPTLCDPMDYSLPGSSIHGIFQARILEWVAFPSPLESWGVYQRNGFSEPRLLHLTIHRKALNFLTWDIYFCLINIYLPFGAKLLYILALPLLLGAVFSGLLEMLPPGLEVLTMSTE